jgi:hypothetical protein
MRKKRRKKSGRGLLGSAGFGPKAAAPRGSGGLNGGSSWRPRWRAGPGGCRMHPLDMIQRCMHHRLPLGATPAQLTLAALKGEAKDGVLTSGRYHRRGGALRMRRSRGFRTRVVAGETATIFRRMTATEETAARRGGGYRRPWTKKGGRISTGKTRSFQGAGRREETAVHLRRQPSPAGRRRGGAHGREEQSSSPPKEVLWTWSGEVVARN